MILALPRCWCLQALKKEESLTPKDSVNYSDSNFQGEASSPYAAKGNKPHRIIKMAIRQVANKLNTYRLVVKTDSVSIPECKTDVLVPLSGSAALAAGLTIVASENPKN